MKIQEFLAILSRYHSTFTRHDEIWYRAKNQDAIDVYDFKKNPEEFFSRALTEKLQSQKNWFDDVLREFELLQNKNIHLLYPGHEKYPKDFLTLENPPSYLAAYGDLSALTSPRISVVGSRHPSLRVIQWMDMELAKLAQSGCTIVSGAARGVDSRAHFVCLRQQRPTIAFLPSGILQPYPKEFQSWIPKIVESGGLVMSEYLLNQTIHSHHFHERNRMIATLGYLLFVCEARRRSGSIMTARLAVENSKTVCALPSFPSEPGNHGGLDLIFNGAFAIRDYADLKELYEAEKLKNEIWGSN